MSSPTPALGNPAVLESLRKYLDRESIPYRFVEHLPTRTSEESAQARGEELSVGAKALLLKVDDTFALFVLPADKKIDSHALRAALNAKGSRFASVEELIERSGLIPGCVPPFGPPVLPFPLYADPLVGAEHGRVAFNAGMLTASIIMATEDWLRVAKPTAVSFAK